MPRNVSLRAVRRILATTTLALILFAPSASAVPITINFFGGFVFNDFEYLQTPYSGLDQMWAFDDAIRATGAVTSPVGQFTPTQGVFGLSLTFDTDVPDLDPSPTQGVYLGAVTGKFWFGDAVFSIGPTDALLTPDYPCLPSGPSAQEAFLLARSPSQGPP